jgi:hypothetical protein
MNIIEISIQGIHGIHGFMPLLGKCSFCVFLFGNPDGIRLGFLAKKNQNFSWIDWISKLKFW